MKQKPLGGTTTAISIRSSEKVSESTRRGLFWWMPPSVPFFVYTVLLKAKPLRRLAQAAIKRLIPERLPVQGVTLALNQADAIVSGALALGCYEPFNLRYFAQLVHPGMVVIDVGANIGLYSAVACLRVGSGGAVVAVEPDQSNCSFIERTRAINGFSNLQIITAGASDRDGWGTLYVNPENLADHRIHDATGTRRSVPVPLRTVDALVDELGLQRVDVVKIDTQGAEAKVLRGMPRTLARNEVKVIVEFWPWGIRSAGDDPVSVLNIIRSSGFTIHEIDGDRRLVRRVDDHSRLLRLALERQHTNLLLTRSHL